MTRVDYKNWEKRKKIYLATEGIEPPRPNDAE